MLKCGPLLSSPFPSICNTTASMIRRPTDDSSSMSRQAASGQKGRTLQVPAMPNTALPMQTSDLPSAVCKLIAIG
ncbi:E3 ubiquitin-protein ligase [Elysia marginata]|uniref:E3 ubiquitin-protein ligase n=1 Tax=Elysia marginata TaxID=1093978 RepID=A0AAV4HE84_9GAST|nr:E3 ubiquitin-protein ligase [Elysia marginata]